MRILLPGYEGTKQVITASSYLLSKYMLDFDIYYLNYGEFDGKLYCGRYISLDDKQIGGADAWAKYLIQYLETIDDELIILADGDFFVTQPYKKDEYKKLLNEMNNKLVGYMSCGYDNKRFSRIAAFVIWNRKFLLDVLQSGGITTIWKFESRGARYINCIDSKDKIVAWRQIVRYDRSSSLAHRRNPGKVAIGEMVEEDIEYLTSNGYIPPRKELILEHPRDGHPILKLNDINVKTVEIILRQNIGHHGAGVERDVAIRWGIMQAIQRYEFAVKCLRGIDNIIDLGCGQGFGCTLLRRDKNFVLGVDKDEDVINFAKENYPGEYLVYDIEEEKDGFEPYNGVVCLGVIHLLKEPQKFIDNLKIEHLVVSAPIKPTPDDDYIYRPWAITEHEFKNMFKNWNIIQEFKQTHYLTIYARSKK